MLLLLLRLLLLLLRLLRQRRGGRAHLAVVVSGLAVVMVAEHRVRLRVVGVVVVRLVVVVLVGGGRCGHSGVVMVMMVVVSACSRHRGGRGGVMVRGGHRGRLVVVGGGGGLVGVPGLVLPGGAGRGRLVMSVQNAQGVVDAAVLGRGQRRRPARRNGVRYRLAVGHCGRGGRRCTLPCGTRRGRGQRTRRSVQLASRLNTLATRTDHLVAIRARRVGAAAERARHAPAATAV